MYLPRSFRVQDRDALAAFMRHFSFATLITSTSADPAISHLPLLLDTDADDWILRGHFARANDHWRHAVGAVTTAVFHGPHSYVSPAWYAVGGEVPTWNYAVVHATGRMGVVEDADALGLLVDELTEKYEQLHGSPWDRELEPAYRARQLAHIVGFELTIEKLVGKFKLGQNRSAEDQSSMHEALAAGDGEARALARFIARLKTGSE